MPTVAVRIATGTDDVEERASGTVTRDSSDLELAIDGSMVLTVGLRFLGIDIPQGAVITSAYIQFQTDEVTTGAASLLIRGEDTGDAAAFTSAAFNTSSRLKTDASIGWMPAPWSTTGEAGLSQRTPDITAIVQEIVSRSDWAALNDMVFLITGSGTRTAEAYESGATTAPLLRIEYSLSAPVVGNLSIDDVSVSEGNSGTKLATFTVSRTGTAPFSVDYATSNGSAIAGSDYAAIPLAKLNFAEGEATKIISATITGDTAAESNETFSVNLSNAVGPGASIVDGTGIGTILDDDTAPVVGNISINDVSIGEGQSGTNLATFTVSRTGTAAFSVNYATANGSATAGSDYVPISLTTLNFVEGEAAKTISATITGDTAAESNETFSVNLSNAVGPGASIVDGTGIGTILDDDTAPVVGNISINDVSISEGQSGAKLATFTVSRTGTAAFSVNYATANGSATAGSDYVPISLTTLNFAAGQTGRTLSVTINGDATVESSETFFVSLSNAVGPGASIVDGVGVGTILNDDIAPTQPLVRNIWSTTGLGSPDPSGLAYVPGKGLFLCDSEVNESPFNSNTNMFLVQPNDGGQLTLFGSYNLKGFTNEPTGLAYVPTADLLFISDDDADRMYWIDPDNPQVKLGEFRTALSGQTDAEDVAYDGFDGDANGGDGHLYIANGAYANIKEVTTNGSLVRTISLPAVIADPEALVWDDLHDMFFVGGKFSSNIWAVDHNGAILDTITLLGNYRRPDGSRVKVTDLELAPSSNPNDDPGRLSLYVADYGSDNFNDGRLFEIDLSDYFLV